MKRETRTTCCYCGVGCGVVVEHDGARITGVRGDPDHPANAGRLCTKGSTLHLTAEPALARGHRLLRPALRATRGAPAVPVGWDRALDHAADRLAAIRAAHGADAIGFYVSGQLLTEDYYAFNKLVKGLLGSNQIDTNSRLCMSSAVAGYKATLGSDAPPCSYEDLAHAGTVFLAGSNAAWAHPVLFRRLEDARRARPGQRWIVVDPRRTETAEAADLHLPLRPGSDVALFAGMLNALIAGGRVDAAFVDAHTRGFDALAASVREWTPARAAAATGVPAADIVAAAQAFADGPTLSLYCQGLNQSSHGTANNAALIDLHLATGQIGRAGAGPFSLTGQPNAMGGREVGGLANLLSAHRDLANPEHRAEVARLWGVPDVPARPGRGAVEMFEAAAEGEVRALWIACTNPAQSLPDQATVRRALERAEFVVVQEAFATTATAGFADLLLPATTWGEKDGTVTNSERRISRVRPAVTPPGEARPDWAIAADLARRLAARIAPERARLFGWADAESVWLEHRESTRGRDLDITGLSYAMLDAHGPQQWPLPEGAATGRDRLYEDRRFATPDGRARFVALDPRPPAEDGDAEHPFALNTGRLRDQWHGTSRTGQLGRLFAHDGEPCVELHPGDLARLGLADGELARLRSRRGELVVPARASDRQRPGQAFVAMHWGGEILAGRGVNELTNPARCPTSRQPELKHAAIAVEPAALPWRLSAMAWLPRDAAAGVRAALLRRLAALPYACVLPFGREPETGGEAGLRLRAAGTAAPDAALLDDLRALLGLGDDVAVARYDDPAGGRQRVLRAGTGDDGRTRLAGFWLAGADDDGDAALRARLESRAPLPVPLRALLAPGASAGAGAPSTSPQVCNCFDVRADRIDAVLARCDGAAERRLATVQRELRCGTSCGSCLPTLRRLAAASVAAAAGPSAGR